MADLNNYILTQDGDEVQRILNANTTRTYITVDEDTQTVIITEE